ncbi:hypothetical protein AAVH_01087 [Aphelenchoides avenae]|nr:hypothetical protein AAVH_01087 [Aphelenchus avenae]
MEYVRNVFGAILAATLYDVIKYIVLGFSAAFVAVYGVRFYIIFVFSFLGLVALIAFVVCAGYCVYKFFKALRLIVANM